MKEFTRKKLIRELWFDKNNFINENALMIEHPESTHNYHKSYRVDYKFHISGENYFCLEFFEEAHNRIDDPEHKIESNRIFSILHNSDDRYRKSLFFAISIYNSWKEQDSANISIDELNSTIKFKNISCKTKHYNDFIDKIDRHIKSNTDIDDELLNDIEDSDNESIETIKPKFEYKENYYKDNMLTFAGLYWYLHIRE